MFCIVNWSSRCKKRSCWITSKESFNFESWGWSTWLFVTWNKDFGIQKEIESLKKKFREQVMGKWNYKTPDMPNCLIVWPTNNSKKISVKDQKLFWFGIGLLKYLVKHSKPDIANTVWELSKVMDGANKALF